MTYDWFVVLSKSIWLQHRQSLCGICSQLVMPLCMQVGGNSLQTGAVCSHARSALGIEANIPAGWLFTHQTIRSLAGKIARDVLEPGAVRQAPLLPTVSQLLAHPAAELTTPMPLSFQQVHIPLKALRGLLPVHGCLYNEVGTHVVSDCHLLLWVFAGTILAALAAGANKCGLQHTVGHLFGGQFGHGSFANSCATAGRAASSEREATVICSETMNTWYGMSSLRHALIAVHVLPRCCARALWIQLMARSRLCCLPPLWCWSLLLSKRMGQHCCSLSLLEALQSAATPAWQLIGDSHRELLSTCIVDRWFACM